LALGQDSLAIALETIDAADAVVKIETVALEKKAERIYVGLPISLSGEATESTKKALELAGLLASRISIPVFVIDERLTSAQSLRLARATGMSAKESKSFVDAEAARLIVESAISSNHNSGTELEEYLARN
jgi:putative Holliday junction resolvase